MTIYKCKGCNKQFQNKRGLSSHFQHKLVCKSIHHEIAMKDKIKLPPVLDKLNKVDQENHEVILTNKQFSKELLTLNKHNNFDDCDNEILFNEIVESNFDNTNNLFFTETNILTFHNNEHVENSLSQLMLEINAPKYAYKLF